WVRLVGVLVALVAVLLTWRLGARLFSEGTGLLAGGFLATTLGFVLESRTLRPDGLLMASVVGGLAGWRAAEDAPERRRTLWLAARHRPPGPRGLAEGLPPLALGGIPV